MYEVPSKEAVARGFFYPRYNVRQRVPKRMSDYAAIIAEQYPGPNVRVKALESVAEPLPVLGTGGNIPLVMEFIRHASAEVYDVLGVTVYALPIEHLCFENYDPAEGIPAFATFPGIGLRFFSLIVYREQKELTRALNDIFNRQCRAIYDAGDPNQQLGKRLLQSHPQGLPFGIAPKDWGHKIAPADAPMYHNRIPSSADLVPGIEEDGEAACTTARAPRYELKVLSCACGFNWDKPFTFFTVERDKCNKVHPDSDGEGFFIEHLPGTSPLSVLYHNVCLPKCPHVRDCPARGAEVKRWGYLPGYGSKIITEHIAVGGTFYETGVWLSGDVFAISALIR